MRMLRTLRRFGSLTKEIEFFLILSWLLLFPGKRSYLYFLGCAGLVGIFLLKEIYRTRNIGVSPFSHGLLVINLVFLFSIFFSSYHIQSVLLVSDVLLVSLYFFLSYVDHRDEDRYFRLILISISLFSFGYLLNSILLVFKDKNIFFENPILQGVGSGAGVIVAFFYIVKKFRIDFFVLLGINLGALVVCGSKAAFLGVTAAVISLVVVRKKSLFPLVAGLLVLTFLVPNPVKNAFYHSLKHDPYVLNRLDIWNLSWNMFRDHFLVGVGPDNFQEVSKKYNFIQKNGPANYFKIPRSPHNDYLKIMTETGLAGAILILIFAVAVSIRIFSSSLFDLNKILVLYLLFQAFLFNILFQFFFLFLVMFVLKNLFEKTLIFRTLPVYAKLVFSGFLIFIFVFSYLFPFMADRFMQKSKGRLNLEESLRFLDRSCFFNPFDQDVYYSKSLLLFSRFQRTSDLKSFLSGVENLKRAQKLNRNYLPAYLLEFDFYLEIARKGLNYPVFPGEWLEPLQNAQLVAPFNPFVRLMKARVYMESGESEKAKNEALAALDIEPDYLAARYFLQENFHYFSDPKKFERDNQSIFRKARATAPAKGSYLYELFKMPARQP